MLYIFEFDLLPLNFLWILNKISLIQIVFLMLIVKNNRFVILLTTLLIVKRTILAIVYFQLFLNPSRLRRT